MPEQHKPSVLDGFLSALETSVLEKVPEGARPAARQELRTALAGAQADGYRIGWEDAAAIGPATSLADLLYDETGPGAEPVHPWPPDGKLTGTTPVPARRLDRDR